MEAFDKNYILQQDFSNYSVLWHIVRIYLEDLNKIKQLDDIFFILLAVVIFSTFFYYETKIKIFTKKCDFENTKKVNESIKK